VVYKGVNCKRNHIIGYSYNGNIACSELENCRELHFTALKNIALEILKQFNGPLRSSEIQHCIPTLLRQCRRKSNCILSDKPGWFSSLTFSQIT